MKYTLRYIHIPIGGNQINLSRMRAVAQVTGGTVKLLDNGLEITVEEEIPKKILNEFRSYESIESFERSQ